MHLTTFHRRSLITRVIATCLIGCLLITGCHPSTPPASQGGEDTHKDGPTSDESAGAVVRELQSITDSGKRQVAAVLIINTLCSLSRLAAGQASGRLETLLAPKFATLDAGAKTKIRKAGDTLAAIPKSKRSELLGRFAADDPGACGAAPDWEKIRHDVIFFQGPVPRLRANFCSGNLVYGDGTRADRAVTSAPFVFQNVDTGPANVAPAASPVILGVEGEHVTARHPALSATNTSPIKNGISPYGVETNIPCTLANDPCTASQGLICGQKLNAGAHCIAFPVVQKDTDLVLRGYNFWDVESARLVFTPLITGSGVESTAIVREVDANEPTDGNAACPVASSANPTHNRAHFSVAANEGSFYRLHLYNHNGTFRTQRDGLEQAAPRVIHTCYPAAIGTTNQLPPGTVRDCTAPVETCPQDGAVCTATWGTPPRKLDQCGHAPGAPVTCGETPEWFVNQPLTSRDNTEAPVSADPVVFVFRDEPTYEFRATLQALECKEETGVDFLGSDEPMVLVAGFTPDIPPGAAEGLIDHLDENAQAFHGEDFDSGTRKQIGKLLSSVGGLHFDSQVVYLVALMEDDGFLGGFLAGAAVIIATAAIVYFTGGAALLAAGGGAALGIGLWTPIMAGIAGDDMLGRATLLATPTLMDERIGADHLANLLTAPPPFGALPPLPGAPTDRQRANPSLIHPFQDFKLGKPLPAECDPGTCDAGMVCLVQRCVPSGFVDPSAGRGFRERREFADSDSYYAVDLLWEKIQTP